MLAVRSDPTLRLPSRTHERFDDVAQYEPESGELIELREVYEHDLVDGRFTREAKMIGNGSATGKTEGILLFLRALGQRATGWKVKDHWAGDLTAIGVVSSTDSELLAYVSSWEEPDDYYYIELEEQAGSVDYETVGRFERCALEVAVGIVVRHLIRDDVT